CQPAQTPPANVGDHRQLPPCPAGHPGNIHRPRSIAQTRRTNDAPNGKRIPGLKLDHPRQLAVMHALVRFANIATGEGFRSADIHPVVWKALGAKPSQYTPSSFRYDLSKLRAKGLVEKIAHSRRYRLVGKGYSVCLI